MKATYTTFGEFSNQECYIIIDASNHIKNNIISYYYNKQLINPKYDTAIVEQEKNDVIQEINEVTNYALRSNNYNKKIKWSYYLHICDVLNSMLNYYRDSLNHDYKKVKSKEVEVRISKITELIDRDMFISSTEDMYNAYRIINEIPNKKGLLFISYSSKDKLIAGLLYEKLRFEYDVFLAHEKIQISKDWRNEILNNLKKCNALIALVTNNFISSCWANQEIGYVLSREIPIIPIFFINEKRAGFLESKQGIIVLSLLDLVKIYEKITIFLDKNLMTIDSKHNDIDVIS